MGTFYAPNDYRNYIAHFGVKGMKWGVRKADLFSNIRSRIATRRSARLAAKEEHRARQSELYKKSKKLDRQWTRAWNQYRTTHDPVLKEKRRSNLSSQQRIMLNGQYDVKKALRKSKVDYIAKTRGTNSRAYKRARALLERPEEYYEYNKITRRPDGTFEYEYTHSYRDIYSR